MTKVSIIAPAYNHEKYIKQAIESVLNQTFKDFELIITDDGSTDNTLEIIKSFNDPRIKLFAHEKNKGAIAASHNSFMHSTGDYIAYLTTDDVYAPDKIEKQVEFLDKHHQIISVFSHALIINENGEKIEHSSEEFYKQKNRSRHEWLRHFFFVGNPFCPPTQMLRRDVFEKMGGYYKNNYRQQNDFESFIRLCFAGEIHILPEALLNYRIRDNNQNASALTPEIRRRLHFETKQALNHYKNIDNIEEFIKIFPEAKKYILTNDNELIPYYLAKLILDTGFNFDFLFDFVYKEFALEILFGLLENSEIAKKLSKNYNFEATDFHKLTGTINKHYDYIFAKCNSPDKNIVKDLYKTSELFNMLFSRIKKNIKRAYR